MEAAAAPTPSLESMPLEILCEIMKKMEPDSIILLSMTNKHFKEIVFDPEFDFVWKELTFRCEGSQTKPFNESFYRWSRYCISAKKQLNMFLRQLKVSGLTTTTDLVKQCTNLMTHLAKYDHFKLLEHLLDSTEALTFLKLNRKITDAAQIEACKRGSLQFFRVLSKNNLVDINIKQRGTTCIELAAANKRLKIIQFILKEFISSQRDWTRLFTRVDMHALLMRCAKSGDVHSFKIVIDSYISQFPTTTGERIMEMRALINTVSSKTGSTVLMAAVMANHREMTRVILEEYQADFASQNIYQKTIVDLALWFGHIGILEQLLDINNEGIRQEVMTILLNIETSVTVILSSILMLEKKIPVLEKILPYLQISWPNHNTILSAAVSFGNVRLLDYLLDYFRNSQLLINQQHDLDEEKADGGMKPLNHAISRYGSSARVTIHNKSYHKYHKVPLAKNIFKKMAAYIKEIRQPISSGLYFGACPNVKFLNVNGNTYTKNLIDDDVLLQVVKSIYSQVGTGGDVDSYMRVFEKYASALCFKTLDYLFEIIKKPPCSQVKNSSRWFQGLLEDNFEEIPPSLMNSIESFLKVENLYEHKYSMIVNLIRNDHLNIEDDELLFIQDSRLLKSILSSGNLYNINQPRVDSSLAEIDNFPLMWAIYQQNWHNFSLLLKFGADPNIASHNKHKMARIFDQRNCFSLLVFCKLIVSGMKITPESIEQIQLMLRNRTSVRFMYLEVFIKQCEERVSDGETIHLCQKLLDVFEAEFAKTDIGTTVQNKELHWHEFDDQIDKWANIPNKCVPKITIKIEIH